MPTAKTNSQKTPARKTLPPKTKATPKLSGHDVGTAKGQREPEPVTSTSKVVGPSISAEERRSLVERAAYFRAEKRGFTPGFDLQDWVEAEVEVLRLIGSA